MPQPSSFGSRSQGMWCSFNLAASASISRTVKSPAFRQTKWRLSWATAEPEHIGVELQHDVIDAVDQRSALGINALHGPCTAHPGRTSAAFVAGEILR